MGRESSHVLPPKFPDSSQNAGSVGLDDLPLTPAHALPPYRNPSQVCRLENSSSRTIFQRSSRPVCSSPGSLWLDYPLYSSVHWKYIDIIYNKSCSMACQATGRLQPYGLAWSLCNEVVISSLRSFSALGGTRSIPPG